MVVIRLCCLFWLLGGVRCANGELTNDGPCIYRGRLTTKQKWFGYLINITIIGTGRISFEFSYSADQGCQNILFYTENQVSVINARMNCWQKEALLRPEKDQILPLSPQFSWSGCHKTYPNSVATYTCHSGRSFTASESHPTTYYMAVSNCLSANGLDLQYYIELVGHIGDCNNGYFESTVNPNIENTPKIGELSPKDSNKIKDEEKVCVIEGVVKTSETWYGFLANITFAKGGGFRFRFSYIMFKQQKQFVILYSPEDMEQIAHMSACWEKQYGVVHSSKWPDQILDLSMQASWNGCVSKNISQYRRNLTCQGKRRFDTPRQIYIAVSNCKAKYGLRLQYRFEVFGYEGDLCSIAGSIHSSISTVHSYIYVLLSWTVMLYAGRR